jgi:sugar-specific transcriptional regulator TrmB
MEDAQTLVEIGFTFNQAKVYLTLHKKGRLSGRTVAKHSQVPRQAVYRVLDELQNMGFVEKIVALPFEFEAVPVHDALSILMKRKAKKHKETEKKAKMLCEKLGTKKEMYRTEESKLCIIPGEETLVKRIRNMLCSTQTSLDLITTMRRWLQAIHYCLPEHKKALGRGAKYRLIINEPTDRKIFQEKVKDLLAKPNFQMRFIRNPPKADVAIFDRKDALITVDPEADLIKSPIVLTDNPSLLAICQEYFETIWITAIEPKLEEQTKRETTNNSELAAA